MSGEALSRREREKAAQRRDVLGAALDLFSRKGYHNVSMQEIAQASEFATGTLYKFFRNKEELYRALNEEVVYKFHDALVEALEGPGPETEKLRSYVRVKGEIFRANVEAIRLYFAETHGARFNILAGLDAEVRRRREAFRATLAAVFERGMKRKRFRRIADPYHLAVALESLTNAFLLLWLDAPERHPYPEDPDVILNLLFQGLADA